ncbi:hypothetical protein FO519_000820 [Halicephalobus sp. NKZ332]|nr:hypothetical protein FO519_000820 [Halicephalobus sp. NKZ332]
MILDVNGVAIMLDRSSDENSIMVVTKTPNSKGKGSGKYERMSYKIEQVKPAEEYKQALENFQEPDLSQATRERGCCTLHPNPLIEEYFNAVAMTGTTMMKWYIVRSPFLWKLNQVLDDMKVIEEETKPIAFMDKRMTSEQLDDLKKFIMDRAKSFDNAPFTIQRLCELLALPTVHYRIAEKFYRAVERNINVVMEVSEEGKRITGVEEPQFVDDDAASSICETDDHIEKHFLVCVDEVDMPLEEQKRASMERSDSSEEEDHNRSPFKFPEKLDMPDRPETPPPNEDVIRLSSEDVPMEQQFGSFGKRKSPFKEPSIDMFSNEDTQDQKPSTSNDGFVAPELPIHKSPSSQKRYSPVDGDAHMSEEEFKEEIPTKMPKEGVQEPMDS